MNWLYWPWRFRRSLAPAVVCAAVGTLTACRASRTPTSPSDISNPAPPTAACAFGIGVSGAPFNAAGGAGSVSVTTDAGCRWTVNAGASSWIGVQAMGQFAGSSTFAVTVAPNRSFSSRSALLAVAEEHGTGAANLSLMQRGAGCLYDVDPRHQTLPWWGTFPPGETSIMSVSVHADPAGCSWTATPTVPWITRGYQSPLEGRGDATIYLFVYPNSETSKARTGEIVVAGLSGLNPDATLVVTQDRR